MRVTAVTPRDTPAAHAELCMPWLPLTNGAARVLNCSNQAARAAPTAQGQAIPSCCMHLLCVLHHQCLRVGRQQRPAAAAAAQAAQAAHRCQGGVCGSRGTCMTLLLQNRSHVSALLPQAPGACSQIPNACVHCSWVLCLLLAGLQQYGQEHWVNCGPTAGPPACAAGAAWPAICHPPGTE